MQIWISSILTVYEPNIDFFPSHFDEKNLPQNHANSYLIDFDCLEPNIDLVLLHFHEKNLLQNHANPFLVDFDCFGA